MIDSLDKVKELTSLVSRGIVATNNGDPDLERFQQLAKEAVNRDGEVDVK